MIQYSQRLRGLIPINYSFAIWTGLNIIDAICTSVTPQSGNMEVNPVVGSAIAYLGVVPTLTLKVILAGLIGILVIRWKPKLMLHLNIIMAFVAALAMSSIFIS